MTHMVAAYNNAECVIYDIETGNPTIKLDTAQVSLKIYTDLGSLIGNFGCGSSTVWKFSKFPATYVKSFLLISEGQKLPF